MRLLLGCCCCCCCCTRAHPPSTQAGRQIKKKVSTFFSSLLHFCGNFLSLEVALALLFPPLSLLSPWRCGCGDLTAGVPHGPRLVLHGDSLGVWTGNDGSSGSFARLAALAPHTPAWLLTQGPPRNLNTSSCRPISVRTRGCNRSLSRMHRRPRQVVREKNLSDVWGLMDEGQVRLHVVLYLNYYCILNLWN